MIHPSRFQLQPQGGIRRQNARAHDGEGVRQGFWEGLMSILTADDPLLAVVSAATYPVDNGRLGHG